MIFSLFIVPILICQSPINFALRIGVGTSPPLSRCYILDSRRIRECRLGYVETEGFNFLRGSRNFVERKIRLWKLKKLLGLKFYSWRSSILCCPPSIDPRRNPRKPRKNKPKESERIVNDPPPPPPIKKGKLNRFLSRVGDKVDRVLNTSISYRQREGYTWTFRPFKVFSLRDDLLEKYPTPRRIRGGGRAPPPRPEIESNSVEEDNDSEPISGIDRRRRPEKLRKKPHSSFSSTSSPLVSIRRNGLHLCSGVILDSTHIATSATCFVSQQRRTGTASVNINPANLGVTLSHLEDDAGEDEREVEHVCVHKTVERVSKDLNEVAVLTLKNRKPFEFNRSFQPAKVRWSEELQKGRRHLQAAWISSSANLETSQLSSVTQDLCKRRHNFVMRTKEVCMEVDDHGEDSSCSKKEMLGGSVECGNKGDNGMDELCGIITVTSCPTRVSEQDKRKPVNKISPMPNWVHAMLTTNSLKNCL